MNNKSNLHYKRLFVLQPSYYKKLSEIYNERGHLNEFGREISDILFDKNLNDTQKYYSYVKNLSKRLSQLQGTVEKKKSEESKIVPDIDLPQSLIKLEQTAPKVLSSIETQVSPIKLRNKFVQTDQIETLEENKHVNAPIDEIFEYIPPEDESNAVSLTTAPDHFLDEKLHEIAQKHSGEKNMNNIVVDREKSFNTNYKVFYNLKTEDEIAIEIQPVYDLLYNNKTDLNWVVTKEKKPLKGRFIVVSVSEIPTLPPTEKISKKRSENVLEQTLFDLALSNAPSHDTSANDIIIISDSIDKDYRIFQDNKSGKKIAVEVAPVYDNLLNKTDTLDLDVSNQNDYIILRSRKIKKKKISLPISSAKNPKKKSKIKKTKNK